MKQLIVIICIHLSVAICIAQRGKDGNKTVSTSNLIVNEYTTLTADAHIGDLQITVQNNTLNSNSRFAANLAPGDLLLIIQMQGATLNGSFFVGLNNTTFGLPKDSTWGSITNYNNCGNYQLLEVSSISGSNTINLSCQLVYDFDVSGKTQIVRVPRFNNFTVNSIASVTCDLWNGQRGGIIIYEVDGTFTLNGIINADAKGFRGGAKDNRATLGLNEVASDTSEVGAEKGEGIGGYKSDYNYLGGRYCKGAPANAGGGGDCHNAGGGGGGNGGNINSYYAVGVPDISNPNYITAFNLEVPGFANVVSSGGGRGGYSASSSLNNPLVYGPGNSGWNGDFRIKNGGYGGRPLDYGSGRLFMGGAGGAGDMNENYGGRGGNAGGMVYSICYGPVLGSGIISCNGENGESTTATSSPISGNRGQDGAGGAGAGGTIIFEAYSTSTPVTCRANGGNGGNQTLFNGFGATKNQAQGPGGGGGGGFIKTTIPTINTSVNGGINGITNSTSMTNFPCNGATKGAPGTVVDYSQILQISADNDTICPNTSTNLVASIQNDFVFTQPVWYDAPFGGNLLAIGSTFTTPVLNTTTDYYVAYCPLFYRKKISVIVLSNTTLNIDAGPNQQICNQTTTSLQALPLPNNFIATWSTLNNTATIQDINNANTNVSSLQLGNNKFIWSVNNGCEILSDTVIVKVDSLNPQVNAGVDQQLCATSTTLFASNSNFGVWQSIGNTANIVNANSNTTTVNNLQYGQNLFVYYNASQNSCPSVSDSVTIISYENPSAAFAGNDLNICEGSVTLQASAPIVGTGIWSALNTNNNIINSNSSNTLVTNLLPGLSQFVYTVSNGNCVASSDTVSVIVNQAINANAGQDKIVCTDTISLMGNTVPQSNSEWISLGTASIANNIQTTTLVSNLVIGNNSFVLKVNNSFCEAVYDTVIINRTEAPSIANAGSDFITCFSNIQLQAIIPSQGIGTWSSTNVNIEFQNILNSSTTANNLSLGSNLFNWVVSKPNCQSTSSSVYVTYVLPDTNIKGMNDTTVLAGIDAPLYINGGVNFTWEPQNFLSCYNCSNPVFNAPYNFSYQIIITDANGCEVRDSLHIKTSTEKYVELPDVFSPSATLETNRVLRIRHGSVKSLSLTVFDEWGNVVFEITDDESPDKTWDGTYKGAALNPAVFNYMLIPKYLDNSTEIKKGKIMLIR